MFEKLLEGRSYAEVPDIVARICGICPVAYQMSAVQALESAFGVQVSAWVQDLRRAMYDCYACYGPAENVNTQSLSRRLEGLGLTPEAVAARFHFIDNGAPAFLDAGLAAKAVKRD